MDPEERNEMGGFDIDQLFAEEPPQENSPPGDDGVEGSTEEAEVKEQVSEEVEIETPAPQPAEPTTSEKGSDELARIKEELQESRRYLTELQSQVLRNQTPKEEAKAPKGPDLPSYEFQIPDELANGIYSDDVAERKAALASLVSGIGQSVHATLRAEVEQRLQGLQQSLPQQVEQFTTATSERDKIRADFYGTFKELDRPEIYPLVKHYTAEVMKAGRHKNWTPQLRDEIGQKVKEFLGQFAPQKTAKAPAQTRPGTRPPAAPADPTDQFAELLDF